VTRTMILALTLALGGLVALAAGCCSDDTCDAPCVDGGAGDGASGGICATERTLEVSSDPIVNLFVKGDKLLVVHEHGVVLLDPFGRRLVSRPHPSSIHTAVLDGETLVVTDKARATVYTPALKLVRTFSIPQPCGVSLIVSGPRLCCFGKEGSATIDTQSGEVLASGTHSSSNPRPVHRVPGTDLFVTTGYAPFYYSLYFIHPATGEDTYACDEDTYSKPKHSVPDTVAFDRGGRHMVDRTGIKYLLLDGKTTGNRCFQQDGALASVPDGSYFVGMDDDAGRGHIVGLLGSGGELDCKTGCKLMRVDVAADTVLAQRPVDLKVGAMLLVRFDPLCGGAAVAYSDDQGVYRVVRMALK